MIASRLLTGAAIGASLGPAMDTSTTTPPLVSWSEGVDVSSYDHPNGAGIDWRRVAGSGRAFAVVKISEGTGYVNPYAVCDSTDAAAAGLVVRGYHFARPLSHAASSEWAYADLHRVGGVAIDLDLEDGAAMGWARLAAWAADWLNREAAARLYVNRAYLDGLAPFGAPWGHELWYARPGVAAPGRPCAVWQYGQGPVPGIARTACDLDRLAVAAPPSPSPGGYVVGSGTIPGEPMHYTDVSITTDAAGNGWADLPGIDPKKVVAIAPDGAFPFPGGYVDVGAWSVATGSHAEAVAVVTAAKPSWGHFARVWSLDG